MFGVVICPGCRWPRAINLSSNRSTCPRCGKTVDVRKAQIQFQSSDPREVRIFITKMNDAPDIFQEPDSNDPCIELLKNIQTEKDPVEKLRLIAVALCHDTGTFTLSDLEKFAPGKSEQNLHRMMECFLVLEKRPGVYQVI